MNGIKSSRRVLWLLTRPATTRTGPPYLRERHRLLFLFLLFVCLCSKDNHLEERKNEKTSNYVILMDDLCVCVCVKVKVYVTWKRENHLRLYLRADISKDNNEKRNNHGIRTEFKKLFFPSSNTSKDTSKHRIPAVKKYNPINKNDQ